MITQEQEGLLLKDLCARLSYGVKVQIQNEAGYDVTFQLSGYLMGYFYVNGDAFEENEILPYLRPISSMTAEELNEYENFITNEKDDRLRFCNELIFYNSHHLDYRGLIPMGLALEAPKDMYNF